MIRRNFLKGLAALIAAPKVIEEVLTKKEVDPYAVDTDVWFGYPENDKNFFWNAPYQHSHSLVEAGEKLEVGELVAINKEGKIVKVTANEAPVAVVRSTKGCKPNEVVISFTNA